MENKQMNTRITLTLSAVAVAAALATPSVALAGLSANVGLSSNYVWRGISQTDNDPAVSGGLDYDFGNGFSVGTWASNVDFGTGGYELDLYGAYGGKVGAIDYSVGFIQYLYPSHDDFDFKELNASAGYGPATFGVSYVIDAEDTSVEDAVYYSLGLSKEIQNGFTIGGTLGRQTFDDSTSDYTHYQLSVGKGDFTLAFDDNNIDGSGNDPDPKFSISYAHSFDY